MSIRKNSQPTRAVRPSPEMLEGRRLLSATVSGQDIDGDTWTIRLIGPGDLRVIKQDDANGEPSPLNSPTLIRQITIAGTSPVSSRVVGTVQKSATGDGRVYFANMNQLSNRSEQLTSGNGLVSIDMPAFWLADTDPATASQAGTPKASIEIPDGVTSLRFGGADTTAFFGTAPNQRLNQNNTNDLFLIELGLPQYSGTRIVVDRVISSAQPGVTTGTTTGNPTQDSVRFTVAGRLQLFQANSIEGNAGIPSGQFEGEGGTLVQSVIDPFTQAQGAGITGQIGFVRVGGNATNFAVQTNDRISDVFIGGETNNVAVLAPTGIRNISFGLGMDNVRINAGEIETLSANRGAINATVISDESIGRVKIGGDVIASQIQAGYVQQLPSVFAAQQFGTEPTAQSSGGMQVLVAGDVIDSVFSASVEPFNGVFGTPLDLELPHGSINAKVEGTIDNSNATPASPNTAFYANDVRLVQGPVIPPAAPQAPYTDPTGVIRLPGIGFSNRAAMFGMRANQRAAAASRQAANRG